MAQQEVINVLTKFDKPLSGSEIAKQIGIAHQNVTKNIRKLIKQNIIIQKKVKSNRNPKPIPFYRLKKKTL